MISNNKIINIINVYNNFIINKLIRNSLIWILRNVNRDILKNIEFK